MLETLLGSVTITRCRERDSAESCRMRVISLTPIEKLCQLRAELPVVLMVRLLVPRPVIPAMPTPPEGPLGLAAACWLETENAAATEAAMNVLRRLVRLVFFIITPRTTAGILG